MFRGGDVGATAGIGREAVNRMREGIFSFGGPEEGLQDDW